MEIALRVIGDVRWRDEVLRGARLPRLLTTLAYAGPGGATVTELIEAIWGEDLPSHPHKALQVLVSRVRVATSARVVERTETGYRLGLTRDEVDVLARDHLIACARTALAAGDVVAAAERARAARRIAPAPGAHRVAAIAASRLGHHDEAVIEIEELVRVHPRDEVLLAHLLRSLAATRGPGAALARFEGYRRELADTLGTDPGPALQAVYRELLAADQPVRTGLRFASTSLLGRDRDLEHLQGLLAGVRLVSIVGSGGLGKTRLAQELAVNSPQPTIHVVELAGVSAGEEVAGTVANALRLRESVAQHHDRHSERVTDVPARLAAHLQGTPSLLVLDNCEHVVAEVADLVAFLLAQVADLRVLTTSRTPLRITAEHVYPLGGLRSVDAVELFYRRARAVRPDATLDEGTVAELVTRLDGLPLAIELAAAKIRTMSVTEILDGLADRFTLLGEGDRSAPDRHQTLLAVIDWSWRLLDPRGREALMYLSVFPDGFTAHTAATVLGEPGRRTVTRLLDQSLLTPVERHGGLRYRMLETVREFGRMRLTGAGLEEQATHANDAWARDLCDSLAPDLHSAGQLRAVDAIRAEETNLAEVLRRALLVGDAGTAMTVLAALGSYWMICGDHLRFFDLVEPVEMVLAGWRPSPELAEPVRTALSVCSTTWAMLPYSRELSEVDRVLAAVGSESSDPFVRALCVLADTLRRTWSKHGAYAEASVESLRMLVDHPHRFVAMIAAPFLAGVLENSGDPDLAVRIVTHSLSRTEPDDPPWLAANHHTGLAQLHAQLGRYRAAADHARDALPVMERLGATNEVVQCRAILAGADLAEGDLDSAQERLAAIADFHRQGPEIAWSMLIGILGQAELAFATGRTGRGLELLDEAVKDARAVRLPGFTDGDGLDPWTVFADSTVLATRAWHDPADDDRAWRKLLGKTQQISRPDRSRHDYPVLGTAMFALACWGLRHRRLTPDDTAALLAFAELLAYNRFLPCLRWRPMAEELARHGPDRLTRSLAELSGRRGPELLPEITRRLELIARADSS